MTLRTSKQTLVVLSALAALACQSGHAAANDLPDMGKFYDLGTQGSSTQLKAGQQGKLVIEIHAKNGAHVSGQSPLRGKLKADKLTLEKQTIRFDDAVSPRPKDEKGEFADVELVKFEVPFTAPAKGDGKLTADLTFFVCAPKPSAICAKETRSLEVPVKVN